MSDVEKSAKNDNETPIGSVTIQLTKRDLETLDAVIAADPDQPTRDRAIVKILDDWFIGQGVRGIPPS